jgi:two-component sensor histidine kinase
MWLTAIATCWVAISVIVVRPLSRMRAAVERYAGGDRTMRTIPYAGTGQELLQFAQAFDAMADQADRHEADMQSALIKQQALTREVHHRVKNNLQIVSSLLSMQERGIKNPEVAEAYVAIRQRVTALGLVHRWIYTGNPEAGVDLRGLLTDLSASLNHSLRRGEHGRLAVTCKSVQIVTNQDVALPLAFLISELAVNIAASGGERFDIVVTAHDNAGLLMLSSEAFAHDSLAGQLDPTSLRIVQGLLRQLRTDLERHPPLSFSLSFPAMRVAP